MNKCKCNCHDSKAETSPFGCIFGICMKCDKAGMDKPKLENNSPETVKSENSREDKPKCKYCYDKGSYSFFKPGGRFGDHFDGHIEIPVEILNKPCPKCKLISAENAAVVIPDDEKNGSPKEKESWEKEYDKEFSYIHYDVILSVKEGVNQTTSDLGDIKDFIRHQKEISFKEGVEASMTAIKTNNWRHDELFQRGMEESYKTLQKLIKPDNE